MSSRTFRSASFLTLALGLTALGSTLTSTGAYAHFSGGSFAGNVSSVGSSGLGHVPTSTAIAGAPVAMGGHSIARSSAIARLPASSGKTGGHSIPRSTEIARLPVATSTGGSSIPTTTKIPQFPRPPLPPAPGTGPNVKPPPPPVATGPIGIPVDVPVGIAVSATVGGAIGGTVDGQVAAGTTCNCLTKQYLSDGSVLFQDICRKESAIAAPMTVGAR
jgi:hypothetical protein